MLGEMGTELSLANLKRMPALPLLISQVPAAPLLPALPRPPQLPTGQGTVEQLDSLSVLVHTWPGSFTPRLLGGVKPPPVPGLGAS